MLFGLISLGIGLFLIKIIVEALVLKKGQVYEGWKKNNLSSANIMGTAIFWLAVGVLCTFAGVGMLGSSLHIGGHKCAICGKTEGLRQITAKTSSGEWDNDWYCEEHYADAWQYYYGNGK